MSKFEDLCLGAVGTDGYYKLGSAEKVVTDKAKDIPVGTYIKPDFTPLTSKEIADYFGITAEEWVTIFMIC